MMFPEDILVAARRAYIGLNEDIDRVSCMSGEYDNAPDVKAICHALLKERNLSNAVVSCSRQDARDMIECMMLWQWAYVNDDSVKLSEAGNLRDEILKRLGERGVE